MFLTLSRKDRFIFQHCSGLKSSGRLKDVRGKLIKLNECEEISKLHKLPVIIVIGDSDKIHARASRRLLQKRLIDIESLPFGARQIRVTWEKIMPTLEVARKISMNQKSVTGLSIFRMKC